MSEGETQEAFFLDTNAVIKWVFETGTPEGRALSEFIRTLTKGRCFVLGISLSELNAIIYDSYDIAARIVYDVVASRQDWDALGIRDRLRVLDDTMKDFEQVYERARYAYFKSYIPPGGIRVELARRFFSALVRKVVDLDSKALKERVASQEKIIDVIDFLDDLEFFIRKMCTVIDDIKALVDHRTVMKLTLIYEGIRRYYRKLESQGFNKTPSLMDRAMLVELFLLANKGDYGKVVLITDDQDFKRMYRTILEYLEVIISERTDQRGGLRELAEELRHVLMNRLEIRATREVAVQQ